MQKVTEIVIVDDSRTPLLVLNQKLIELGYKTKMFLSSKECAEQLPKLNPDLFIFDIEMPDINGISLCKLARAQRHLKNVPVLFYSSAHKEEVLKEAFEAGGFDFLSKSVSSHEIGLRVKNALEISRLRLSDQSRALTFEVLLRVIYHDLATPLTIAQSRISSIINKLVDEDLKEKLKSSLNAISVMTNLTSDLRHFFTDRKIESKSELAKLQKNIEFLFSDRLIKKELSINWTIEDVGNSFVAIPLTFLANQTVGNFLSNAIKFSFQKKCIDIKCRYIGDSAEIIIEDFGPGMPENKVRSILGGGAQKTELGTKGEVGSGSGLMIAMFFIDWYKGKVDIQSLERTSESGPGGTKVTIELPRLQN